MVSGTTVRALVLGRFSQKNNNRIERCTVSVFFILHFTHWGGGAYTHPTHPPAYETGGTNRVASGVTNLNIPDIPGESRRFGGGEKFSA